MPESLGTNYRLDIEVLTPLHIGSGALLLRGFDFDVPNSTTTYRLNEDTILEDKWPDDPAQQRLFLGRPLTDLLERDDYHKHPEYIRYTLSGTPVLREIRECIKDARDRPYIPGSSLKGALRTTLLRVQTDKRVFQRADFGRAGGAREAKSADDMLEKEELGRDPNRDVFRALQVADSAPLSSAALTLQRIQMVPGLTVDVEAIVRGSRFTAWLLAQRGQRGLEWSEELSKRLAAIGRVAQFTAKKRLKHEFEYHAARKDAAAATFYGKLLEEAASDAWPKNEFLLQIGFATGWRAKTVVGGLANDDALLETLVHDFQLDRGGGRKSRGYTRGQAFPKARHLAWVGSTPALPLGWLRIRMVKLG